MVANKPWKQALDFGGGRFRVGVHGRGAVRSQNKRDKTETRRLAETSRDGAVRPHRQDT